MNCGAAAARFDGGMGRHSLRRKIDANLPPFRAILSTPFAKATVPGGWIYLARDGLQYVRFLNISSFSIMAQSLVN